MEKQLIEGTTTFITDSENKISREMAVFYNPVMKLNRDLTLIVLLAMNKKELRIGLPMEASGIRAARILHELVAPGLLSATIALNDLSAEAISYAQKNVALNIGSSDIGRVQFSVNDASQFLRSSSGFDYIDIDPFGTPNPFLDAAVQRISRDGILAVTATDTSALAGTYPAATARKYWSVPSRTWVMHDVGLRILIRKVQLLGAQYEKALIPVLSLATDHYYRLFFRCERSHAEVKLMLRAHNFLHLCRECMQLAICSENTGKCGGCGSTVDVSGPMWTGMIQDVVFIKSLREHSKKLDPKTAVSLDKLLTIVEDECRLNQVGFIDMHELCSRHKLQAPKTDALLKMLGIHGCRTHISGACVKTDLPVMKIVEMLRT